MEIKLEVLISRSIKRKKPCSRFAWLGQEKESVFLFDDKSFCEINLVSGKLKKKIPRLQPLLKNKKVAVLATSGNGVWLAGVFATGEIFIWSKDKDTVKTISATDELSKEVTSADESCRKLFLFVSGDGRRILLATSAGIVFVWESTGIKNMAASRKGPVASGTWTNICQDESVALPGTDDKEATVHAVFIKNETLGDCCLCTFAFFSGELLKLAFLVLSWHENALQYIRSLPFDVRWAHQECLLASLVPPCAPVKSRGALVIAFAGDGQVLAVTINQKDPKATQVLFVNTLNFVTVSCSLKGCSSKNLTIPSKFIRSYWVGDMSWTPNGLFLACMLKRGSLIMLTRLGELLSLITSGCSIEFGPAEFIPLHPLITYRPPNAALQAADANSSLGSSVSENDVMRQRFSVTTHPRLPYLIVSDGYMATALQFADHLSPSSLIKSLLLDSAQRLETMRQVHLPSKHYKGTRPKLRSLSSLKASLLKGQGAKISTSSLIPQFLQGEEEALETRFAKLQDCEEDSEDDFLSKDGFTLFILRPDSSGKSVDRGRLEFASMFDTIHATDETYDEEDVFTKLNCIQRKLLAAWGWGISFQSFEEKGALLNCTVGCLSHLISVLHFSQFHPPKKDSLLTRTASTNSWVHCVFRLFQQCLSLLHWDMPHRQCLCHVTKLTSEAVKLMIVHHQDQPFSRTLLETFCLLKLVTYYINIIYTPQCDFISVPVGGNIAVELDSFVAPLCQALFENKVEDFFSMEFLSNLPPTASNLAQNTDQRLCFLWRFLHQQAIRFHAQLFQRISRNDLQLKENINDDESIIEVTFYHIQATLQSFGDTLDKTLLLNTVIGEERFLMGSYRECVQIWKNALEENAVKGGKRESYLQMRYFLALLYCHLYNNNLNEAQGLCDQLVRVILRQSRLPLDEVEGYSESPRTGELGWLREFHIEAALAVIKSMARFMATYFTNQSLYVLPPHNVNVLPPLHIKTEKLPRGIPLQHSMIANVVRDQNLSSVWTVEYALDLLLIGGLVPEAVWFTLKLGDWKMSVSIGLAYNLFCQNANNFTWLNKADLHLPCQLTPAYTFQEKLQSFLGHPASSEILKGGDKNCKEFSDPIEEDDADLLFFSVQEMLKAAVMAEADILSETFLLLVDSAKDLTKTLCGLVPEKLYLPAPPLYCPQPASVSEGDHGDQVLQSEKESRQKVSGVLQRILLLLRAARCLLPSAQWYIKQLKWARKVMQKIRAKSFLPPLNPLPESLLNYSHSNSAFFKPGPGGDNLDDVSSKIIGCFRELCALCWMLHVRERLSDCCRRYQIARDNMEKWKDLEKTTLYDASVVEQCLNALEWAYRMLPFSAFMNIEELVQDIILSLIGELPPVQKVADILVKAFPSSEAVRVPLRDKYNSLKQRLRHCIVKGPRGEQMMSVLMHDIHKVRLKSLKRVVRNIGPIEVNIWEPEEETPDDEAYCYDRFSLGTSLSRSTLTEFGKPQVYSDADTGDTLSEALMTEEPVPRMEMRITDILANNHNTLYKKKEVTPKAKTNGKEPKETTPSQNVLPIVGTWEFERDDDEYIAFLDLFLSYLLERDLINNSDPCIPFLTSFSEHLREHELNSLLFDVHTTLKRRQGKGTINSVFRAGCSYMVTSETDEQPKNIDQPCNEGVQGLFNLGTKPASFIVLPVSKSSRLDYFQGESCTKTEKHGLFGFNLKKFTKAKVDLLACPTDGLPSQSLFVAETPTAIKNSYKTIQSENVLPSEELTVDMKTKFGSASRLLEWMIRWSEKRLLCGCKKEDLIREYSTMIRVKTSAAAILTSFWLLEERYFGGPSDKNINIRVPEVEFVVAPVFHPEDRPTLQRDTRMVTGYRRSTGTPVDVLEEEPSEEDGESISELSSKEEDHNNVVLPAPRSESPLDEMSTVDPENELEEVRNNLQEEPERQSASEDENEDAFGAASLGISVSITPIQQQTGKRTETNGISLEVPGHEILEEKETENVPTGASSEIASLLSVCPHASVSASSDRTPPLPDAPVPVIEATSEVQTMSSSTPVHASHQDIQEREHVVQPPNTSEAVRQMFQDEMFRLLQLQQINFMSLMQVVGSSFANLPHMQQILQQPPPTQFVVGQTSNNARGLSTKQTLVPHTANEQPSTSVPSVKQPSMVENDSGIPDNISNPYRPEGHVFSDESNKENMQVQQDGKPQEDRSGGTRIIPATRTKFDTPSIKGFPLLTPPSKGSKSIPTRTPLPQDLKMENGFPLLQLSPEHNFKPVQMNMSHSLAKLPQKPTEAWVTVKNSQNITEYCRPQYTPNLSAQPNIYQNDKKAFELKQPLTRWAEPVKKESHKHIIPIKSSFNPSDASRQQNLQLPISNVEGSFQVPQQNTGRLQLLHLEVDPPPFIPTIRPNNPVQMLENQPAASKDIQAPPPMPKLTLLRVSMPLESKILPQNPPFTPPRPRLIPFQNLIAYNQSAQNKPQQLFGPIQLLKANIEPVVETEVQHESKKRLKRRVEKNKLSEEAEQKPEKKASVSFRPEDSLIEPVEVCEEKEHSLVEVEAKPDKKASVSFRSEDSIRELIVVADRSSETITKTKEHRNDAPSLKDGEGFVLPLGLFDSILLEHNKEQGSVPAPAELHYMAATRRRAAEIQDASTNTDHEFLPLPVPQLLPPDLYLNLRFQNVVKENTITDPVAVTAGNQFINVIDIDSSDFQKDLLIETESQLAEIGVEQPKSPKAMSIAQLHHMAATVTNAIPPNEFESTENLCQVPTTQRQNRDVKFDIPGDIVTWNVLHSEVGPSVPTDRPVNTLSAKLLRKEHMNSKLIEMETQLSALQNMAENMELDFANSELLVNTIEHLGSIMNTDPEEIPFKAGSVDAMDKVSSKSKLILNHVGLEILIEEEEDSKSELIVNDLSLRQTPPLFSTNSADNYSCDMEAVAALPRREEVRDSISDDPLQMTGLSDIADIIGDLVRDGGISANELGLTENQAHVFSRVQGSSTGRSRKIETKKKEIRQWMKIKQKERLAEHRKKQEELREREHDPFQPCKDLQRTINSKDIRKIPKLKDEKDKSLLSEHYNNRVSQAVTLMNDILFGACQTPATVPKPPPNTPVMSLHSLQGQHLTSPQRIYSATRSLSARPLEKNRIISRTGIGQTRSRSTPPRGSIQSRGTLTLPKKSSESRLKVHNSTSYPVKMKLDTSLPQDRMSQITRRGIVTDRSRNIVHIHPEIKPKASLHNKRPASTSQASACERTGRSQFRKATKKEAICQTDKTGLEHEERDSLSPWDIPDEINKILNSNLDTVSLLGEDERSPQSLNDIDNVSESTGSILSKLDWNMIEDMVASVGDKSN